MNLQRSPNKSGLGNLSRLPPEIRLEIWDHFSLGPRYILCPHYWSKPYPKHLRFLQASKTVYSEASDFVYRKLVLCITVTAQTKGNCGLCIKTGSSSSRVFDLFEDNIFGHAIARKLRRFPLSKFREIAVEIEPPVANTPGMAMKTLWMIWLQSLRVAELLALRKRKSVSIRIELLDNRQGLDWRTGLDQDGTASNILMCNDLSYWCRPPSVLRPDFEVVLTNFKRLRQFKNAKITFPEPLEAAREFANEVEMLLTREEPFGTYHDPDNKALSDTAIQQADQDLRGHMRMLTKSPVFRDSVSWEIGKKKICKWSRELKEDANRFPITKMLREAQEVKNGAL